MYTNKKKIADGYRSVSQIPLDDRLVFADLAELANLGTGNVNAYRYYEGMTAFVLSEDSFYKWVEGGTIGTFTYPADITTDDVDYSNRAFGFSEVNFLASSIIEDTYANIAILVSGGDLIPNTQYKITDRADNGIILTARTTNSFSVEGQAIFLNPDFQSAGDYSGVLAETGLAYNGDTYGVWYNGTPATSGGDVVFWDGLHYQRVAATLSTDPPDINSDYQVLPKSAANVGYIEEVDFILYDFVNDTIIEQHDKRGNKWNPDIVASFQRGNNACANMIINGFGDIDNINQRGVCNGNLISNGASLNLENTFTGICGGNNLIGDDNVTLYGTSEIQYCTFNSLTSIIITNTNYTGEEITPLGSTFAADLDLSDPVIYDLGTTTLTIPSNLNYIGKFIINAAANTVIDYIVKDWLGKVRYVPFTATGAGITYTYTFNHASIAGLADNQLVSDAAVPTVINQRALGRPSDFIEYETAQGSGSNYYHVRTNVVTLI